MQRFFDFNFFVSLFMCLTHTHTSTLFFSVVEVINRFLMLTRFGGGGTFWRSVTSLVELTGGTAPLWSSSSPWSAFIAVHNTVFLRAVGKRL